MCNLLVLKVGRACKVAHDFNLEVTVKINERAQCVLIPARYVRAQYALIPARYVRAQYALIPARYVGAQYVLIPARYVREQVQGINCCLLVDADVWEVLKTKDAWQIQVSKFRNHFE
jgi:hypothetical protein